MKRAFAKFDQSHSADDEAKEKLKYQMLLKEYLELQKEYVSRKRKLQAAKKKRELTLAEVRFLRRKHEHLLKSQAPNTVKVLHNMDDKETNTFQGGRNPSTINQLLLSNSLQKDSEAEEGRDHVYEADARRTKKIKNHLKIQDKVEGKRKICWPDQVTLNV